MQKTTNNTKWTNGTTNEKSPRISKNKNNKNNENESNNFESFFEKGLIGDTSNYNTFLTPTMTNFN